jgi:hypothetical protein
MSDRDMSRGQVTDVLSPGKFPQTHCPAGFAEK